MPSVARRGGRKMLRVRAVVLRVLDSSARSKGRWRGDTCGAVSFVAQFEDTNSVLSCTLQDRLQADLVVPGRALALSVVGVREDGCSLLVDVEDGPRGTPACIAQVNEFAAAAARLEAARLAGAPRKRQCFAGM